MKCAGCFTIMFLISGTDAIFSLTAFIGDTTKLFPSDALGSHDSTVLIYVNGLKSILIGKWTLKNCTGKLDSIFPSYEEKLFMDRSRNIWIHDVNSSDEGTYTILLGSEEGAPKFYLNLSVSEKKITEEQIQKWLDDYPDFSKKFVEKKMTEEQIQKWLDDYPDFSKKFVEKKMTEEQIQKWLDDHPDFSKKFVEEEMTEEQIQKWLDDHPDFSKKFVDYGKATFVIAVCFLVCVFCKVIWCLWKEFARMRNEKKRLIPYILERFLHRPRRHEHGEPMTTTPAHEREVEIGHGDQESVHQEEHAPLLEDQNEDPMGTSPGETNSMMDNVEDIDCVNLVIERKRRENNAKLQRYGMTLIPRKRNDTV